MPGPSRERFADYTSTWISGRRGVCHDSSVNHQLTYKKLLPSSRRLAIDTIHESTNPRRSFEQSKLGELAKSIRQHGLIQPITVRPNSDGFEIVAGARPSRR